ncbi:R3H and coiled-coil domain-containing protein 1 [Lampris incognitus]|uniref:R3H and coiled-coil domain-containing protein 1 n=1 Tax=Lampris incognitus TaxID=2546036 RepID=UPI0024B5F923|nr:R3H and coiled-coil domain-containing protein 1 [Lampris incognitus]
MNYLPKQETQFINTVLDEIDAYQQKHNHKSVLLFPPLPSRLRYLIHKTTQDNLPELATFSVGEARCRRVVVYNSDFRDEVQEDSDVGSNNSLCEEPLKPKDRAGKDRAAKPKSSTLLRNQRPSRPDKALYMPRAVRARLSLQNPPACTKGQDLLSSSPCSFSCTSINSPSESCSCSDVTESTGSLSSNRETFPSMSHRVDDNIGPSTPDCSTPCPESEKQDVMYVNEVCTWPPALEQTLSAMTLEEEEDKTGDLASITYKSKKTDTSMDTADLTNEIMAHLNEAEDVFIEFAHNDYSCFENVWINPDEFGHVIEIYDFPAVLKTDDLLDAFTECSDGGMKIQWVDNTHALGVFASESAALNALSVRHPHFKTRMLSDGSRKAKDKAMRKAEFIQPIKERPKTSTAVARQMVTRALGLQRRGRVPQY